MCACVYVCACVLRDLDATIMHQVNTFQRFLQKLYESFVMSTRFFIRDSELSSALFNRCKHIIYPPGCILTLCGSGDVFLFIICEGFVCTIDTFGIKRVSELLFLLLLVSLLLCGRCCCFCCYFLVVVSSVVVVVVVVVVILFCPRIVT